MLRTVIVTTGVFIGLGLIASAPSALAQGYSQEQQQLCSGDAFRLCGPEIPDVDRVTACMVRQRALLSPGCRSVFRYNGPAAVAAPERAGPPVMLRAKASKAAKAKARKNRAMQN